MDASDVVGCPSPLIQSRLSRLYSKLRLDLKLARPASQPNGLEPGGPVALEWTRRLAGELMTQTADDAPSWIVLAEDRAPEARLLLQSIVESQHKSESPTTTAVAVVEPADRHAKPLVDVRQVAVTTREALTAAELLVSEDGLGVGAKAAAAVAAGLKLGRAQPSREVGRVVVVLEGWGEVYGQAPAPLLQIEPKNV